MFALATSALVVPGFDWSVETESTKKLSKRCQKVVKNQSKTFICASGNAMVRSTVNASA